MNPGFFEADLVAHCGGNIEGQFLHTFTMTDIATGWTELRPLLRRSEADVLKALEEIKEVSPFPVLGLDTDNGGEFINYEVLDWAQRNRITFTRSREYRKNDQAHVEEKNGSIVRRLIGYDRFEGDESWRLMSELYQAARLYINFFQPCLQLESKERDGTRVRKRYKKAQTPFQRTIASSSVSEEAKEQLAIIFRRLDPAALLKEMERLKAQFRATSINFRNQTISERIEKRSRDHIQLQIPFQPLSEPSAIPTATVATKRFYFISCGMPSQQSLH